MIKKLVFLFVIVLVSECEVFELTNETFKDFTSKNYHAFVYFYSPQCKYCLILEPQFKKLPQMFNTTNIRFGKIDAIANGQIAEQYGIKAYPSLFFYDYTFVIPYKEGRDAQQMADWIKEYLSERVVSVTQGQLASKQKPYVVIHEGSDQQKRVLNQSVHGIDNLNAYSTGQGANTRVVLHTRKGQFQYKEDLQRISLKKWILNHIRTSIVPLNSQENVNKYVLQANKPTLMFVFCQNDRQNAQKYQMLLNICEQYQDKLHCVESIPKYQTHKGAHGYFKVDDKNRTIIGLVKEHMNIAYKMQFPFDKLTKKSLKSFVEGALHDKIQRVVDNVPPTKVKFESVKILDGTKLTQYLKSHKYVFVNFYKSDDKVSLTFSRPYQSFSNIVKEEAEVKDVTIAALDCNQHKKQCEQRKISYYPTLRLYINGVPVQYEQTQKLPQIPDLLKFVHAKKEQKLKAIKNTEDITKLEKPVIIISGSSTNAQLEALPAIQSSLSYYFLKNTESQPIIQLHSAVDEITKYTGKIKAKDIQKWIKSETEFQLSDMMKENPDEKIIEAVKNKQPIIFILDVQKDKSSAYKAKLGSICKKLKIQGAFANGQHPGFNSLLQWIYLQNLSESKLIYSDISTDSKYVYPENLGNMSQDSVKDFIDGIKAGKISKQQPKIADGPRQVTQDEEKQGEKPIVEQL